MPVDGPLPAQELIDGKGIALASFIQAQQTAADRCNDFRLATDNPALGILRRKISNRQRAAIWPNDITNARPVMLCHGTLTRDPTQRPDYQVTFKNCLKTRVNRALENPDEIRMQTGQFSHYPGALKAGSGGALIGQFHGSDLVQLHFAVANKQDGLTAAEIDTVHDTGGFRGDLYRRTV